jgi:arylsulfatase A-like enzyme
MRVFLRTCLLAGTGFLAGFGPDPAPVPARPNVLLLLADDMTYNAIRAVGNPDIRTPTLDSLLRQGTTFTRAAIMGGPMPAVCSPSRAMLLTGRPLYHLERPAPNNPSQFPLEGRYQLLPETFRRAGYATFTTGKHHNGKTELGLGYTQARSVFFGGMGDHVGLPLHDQNPAGAYPADAARPLARHSSEEFAAVTMEFIRQQPRDQPFFAYVPFTAPHDPRQPPAAYRALYDAAKLTLPANVRPDHPFDNGTRQIRDERLLPRPLDPAKLRNERADYYALITHLDAQIGQILATLRATGRAENTLVVFAADNGLALGQHGLLGKQNLYEHSIRVPMIWAGPGIPKGQKRPALVYLHDLYPTLCELAGIAPPASVESTSLVPALRRASAVVHPTQYFSYGGEQRALRDDRYKLIEYVVNGRRTTQLFDLTTDPLEQTNLADIPRQARRLHQMRGTLQRERRVQGDSAAFWNAF